MRMMTLLAACCLLAGCAGSAIHDLTLGPEKLAEQDDAYCKSIGAMGPNYTNCRLFMTQRRDAKHAAAAAALADGLAAAGDSFSRRPSVTCTTYGNRTTCN